ncbi:type II toxin-antitoxin system RelE/ParE family toxin [bacterium]|nr:MAG: type II toxin-antitoxin system RelE/ParE family toxin [bacterium]
MKKKAIYYEDRRNRRPVEKFINGFELKIKAKVLARIEFLEGRWQELRRPYVDALQEGLYELRVIFSGNQIRVIYAYMFSDYIVLLHGIIKKTREVPQEDMLKAKNRMNDFQMRFREGRIKLPKIE